MPQVNAISRVRGTLSSVVTGLVAGVIVILGAVSCAALVFTGDLSQHIGVGVAIALAAAAVAGGLVSALSTYRGSIATLQSNTAGIFSLAAGSIAGALSGASDEVIVSTVVMALALASFLTGLSLVALGGCKLGSLVRFVPYPVVGGFLAGAGWLVSKGALSVLVGHAVSPTSVDLLLRWSSGLKLLVGVGFALVLTITLRRPREAFVFPGMLLGAIVLFYAALFATGHSIEEASAGGWLLGPFPETSLWRSLGPSLIWNAHWRVILEHLPHLGTVALVGILTLMLVASSLELAVERDLDLNRELAIAGLANLGTGLVGGFIGSHALNLSALVRRLGGESRVAGLTSAGLAAAVLLAGPTVLTYTPRPVLGGLLLHFGLRFLLEWLVDARRKLARDDYAIVLLIFAVVADVGLLQGVGVGIVAAVALFVVSYSQIDVVKHVLSGATYRSKVDRSDRELALLGEHGEQLVIFKLQGFTFFGTAQRLLDQVKARLTGTRQPVRFVVLDFKSVFGLDSSAVMSFIKMRQLGRERKFRLLFAHLPSLVRGQLESGGLAAGDDDHVQMFADLDDAVQWCEDQILSAGGADLASKKEDLAHMLSRELAGPEIAATVMRYLERRDAASGEYLLRQNDEADEMFFVESGQVTAELHVSPGTTARLRRMQPGTIVGEVGLYAGLRRTASVVVNEPGVVYRLSATALRRLESEHPRAASALHRFITRRLARRLADTDETLKSLLE